LGPAMSGFVPPPDGYSVILKSHMVDLSVVVHVFIMRCRCSSFPKAALSLKCTVLTRRSLLAFRLVMLYPKCACVYASHPSKRESIFARSVIASNDKKVDCGDVLDRHKLPGLLVEMRKDVCDRRIVLDTWFVYST
jgi:hypothetical protein